MQGRCANHVENVAVGTCERCGSYYCASCYKLLGSKRICSACLAIPGIDYLADTRNKAWGKRDGWVWYIGLMGTLSATLFTLQALMRGYRLQALVTATLAVILLCYFLMLPWARKAIFAVIPLGAFTAILELPVYDGNQIAYYLGAGLGRTLFLLLFLSAAYRSTRNKLAFKIEVSNLELSRYYNNYLANAAGQRALAYGLMSLLIPLLIPVAIVLGLRSLRRIDSGAWPPVTSRGSTILGLASAGLSTAIWLTVIVVAILR
jgi:hypothetical protein